MSTEANWPYERIEELEHEPEPTWECPEGICTCAEAKGDHKDWQFSVMLCEPDGRRMRKARCRVVINGILANEDDPYADGEGWITVTCHHAPTSVYIEWAPLETPRREPYPHRCRYYVDLCEDHPHERVRRRLHNLGFSAQPTLRANVEDFQRAYGYTDVNGEAEDIEQDLVIYHDHAMVPLRDRQSQGGSDERLAFYSPTGESPVAAPGPGGRAVPQHPPGAPQGNGQQKGTAMPPVKTLRIELYKSPDGVWAPAENLKDTKASLWRLEILRGTHTAVTFVDSQNQNIRSTNPNVPVEPSLWVDQTPQAARRSIFFYGRARPEDDHGNHVAMFDPTVLQVEVREWPDDRWIYLWLNGPSVCLNCESLASSGYRLTPFTHTVSKSSTMTDAEKKSTAPLNPTKPNSPENVIRQVMNDVNSYRKQKGSKNLMFNHLVINCHGINAFDPPNSQAVAAWIRLGHDWDYWKDKPRFNGVHGSAADGNLGFSHYNIHLFGALRGMFRYIWLQGCESGGDTQPTTLMAKIAIATGAIVNAYKSSTPELTGDVRPERDHIDFQHRCYSVHCDATGKAMDHDAFFRSARQAAQPDLKESLYFNIVETRPQRPSVSPGSRPRLPRPRY